MENGFYQKACNLTDFYQWFKIVSLSIALAACGAEKPQIDLAEPAIKGDLPASVSAGENRSVLSGEQVILIASVKDGAGGDYSYFWEQQSGPPIILQNHRQISVSFIAPNVTGNQKIELRITLTDEEGISAHDTVLITVKPANTPPVVDAGADRLVNVGENVTIAGAAGDDDGIETYAWAQLSGLALELVNANTSDVNFIVPVVNRRAQAELRLTAIDSKGASGNGSVVITINAPPVVSAVGAQNVNVFDTVALTGSGSDVDSNDSRLKYLWVQTLGPQVELTNEISPEVQFTAPAVNVQTNLRFALTVTDVDGGTATDQVVVVINAPSFTDATLSGTVTAVAGTMTDGDVNAMNAPYAANDSVSGAQHIINPVRLGGYLNRPNVGPAGRSKLPGDVQDYYHVSMTAGQVVNIYMGESYGTDASMYLALFDESGGNVLDYASGAGTLTVTAPADGNYVILLQSLGNSAFSYVMTVGSNLGAQTDGWNLQQDFVPGELIVKFNGQPSVLSAPGLNARAQSIGMDPVGGDTGRNMLMRITDSVTKANAFAALGISVKLTAAATENQAKLETIQAAVALKQRDDVNTVRLNFYNYHTAVPNDQYYNLQWHYPLINLPQAWETTTGSGDIIVAVLDTGILSGHPDLQGQLLAGYDFIRNNNNSADNQPGIDANPEDPGDGANGRPSSFHGTHVAGTIAAASNNSIGVSGVAWRSKIMPLRVLGVQGGTDYDIEQAIRFAAGLSNDSGTVPARKADIINMSLGRSGRSTNPPTAYRLARQAGVIIVAAAGNDATSRLNVPSGYNGVVSVSAVNSSRRLASYSNFGSTVDIAAPGGDSGALVLSTQGDDSRGSIRYVYNYAGGTSMAAPHVAGVAALMKSVYADLTPGVFDNMLANGELTHDIGSAGRDDLYGYGLIDANKAVVAAANAGGIPPAMPPVLKVAPLALNFGVAFTSLQISVSNSGEGTLTVNNVDSNSEGWLSVLPESVDNNGLGLYTAYVERSGLAERVYTASITISSNAGTVSVPVSMQVVLASVEDNAGLQLIELVDKSTNSVVDSIVLTAERGAYRYLFPKVPLGVYGIRASSDLDNDGKLFELGEAFGAYPTLDNTISTDIPVDGSASSINNLDFETGYSINLSTQ